MKINHLYTINKNKIYDFIAIKQWNEAGMVFVAGTEQTHFAIFSDQYTNIFCSFQFVSTI